MTEDKNYWLNEWRQMMCGMMYESSLEFTDTKVHCNTPDGVVTCSECRYFYLYEEE